MSRFIYVSAARLPSEMAHGLQIMQNCEAFAEVGADVTLWYPRRWNTPEMRAVSDTYAFYGVAPRFAMRRLPTLDLINMLGGERSKFYAPAFYLMMLTYALAVMIVALFTRADVFYSRDPLVLLLLSMVKPKRQLAYEAHRLNRKGAGSWLQTQILKRVGLTVAITPPLRDDLHNLHAGAKIIVAHDGVRRARFEYIPSQADSRQKVGWPQETFIIGYVGRLQTLGMAKGIDTLIQAIAQMPERESCAVALVGGPDEYAEEYRALWVKLGLSPAHFLYAGQVTPDVVPMWMGAFDVCAMPHPRTEHFALHTSPLKLFEYMASGRAVVASDLPSWADVITDEIDALLVPPSDVAALSSALSRLYRDSALLERLAAAARQRVMTVYTWDARARHILEVIGV
jgi:glycosyltransferase involved in cell wall biosynthesis